MLLYSFLGILTLQLGVAVLSGCFITLAAILTIANFLDIQAGSGIPLNYILLGLFIVLLLIAGLVMFLAAYKEKKEICIFAAVLVGIILILFLVASIVSFLNLSNVCVSRRHCPETLWLSSLNYKPQNPNGDSNAYYEYYDETEPASDVTHIDTTTGTMGPDDDDDDHGSPTTPQGRRRRAIEKETDESYLPERPFLISDNSRNDSLGSLKNSSSTLIQFQLFPNNSSHVKDKGNTGISQIIRRSLFYVVNYMREPHQIERKHYHPKYSRSDDDENDEEDGDEDDTLDIPVVEKRGRFQFGIPFIIALILFLVNTVFFIFTIVVLWSHGTQIKYLRRYSEDPASKYYVKQSFSSA